MDSMPSGSLADLPVLYLTTVGRSSGLPRRIEIWFVASGGRFYLLAEHFRRAQWVRNIERNPRVEVRIGGEHRTATARILDETADAELWRLAQDMARAKYGWGDGLPVEIAPDQPLT
jgi:deazaflavin-dependent oxidoreductase (nitroreductase family)